MPLVTNPAKKSLERLSLLLGIPRKRWVSDLSEWLGVERTTVSTWCKEGRKVPEKRILEIESRGYPRKQWLIEEPIGERIRQIRAAAGLSQGKFAGMLKANKDYLDQVESGKKEPDKRLIQNILDRFAVDKEWLLSGGGAGLSPLRILEDRFQESPPDNTHGIHPEGPILMDHEDRQHVGMVLDILCSNDQLTKDALKMNIVAFHQQIQKNKILEKQKQEVAQLKREVDQLKKSIGSCDAVAAGAPEEE